ncbi:hypothetical protein ACFQ09_11965 [Massilia norwichensis]|jgi:hypothetical protein|uniref:YqjK-like protein n=1 Tax=Massilia norwichensis TaxID=1442366 RepID=A0ABT2A492_9BURK|nr:hypothetical protein [Massilia norwichensis]MCS0589006.1 hypothetical protein [Massilia norwichensis]
MNKPTLAARRAALLERCAEQRTGLAYELQSLRPSAMLDHPVAGYVVGHKKLVFGALGATLGMALLRRKRMLALAGSAMSAWRMAQGGLAMLAQLRR